jgi:hypothetical protein
MRRPKLGGAHVFAAVSVLLLLAAPRHAWAQG